MMDHLDLGDLHFRVRWSTRRKTLGLTVERDGTITLAAPVGCSEDRLVKFARSRTYWVYIQLAKRDLLNRPREAREFVTGEGFTYLGRTYRLLLVDPDGGAPLSLKAGRLQLHRDRVNNGHDLLRRWYIKLGNAWLNDRVQRIASHAGVDAPAVQVQELGFRWGSCGRNGRLYFHYQVMTLPPALVEYVVAHELVHLKEPHHTPTFWRLLSRILPDFELRRDRLAQVGGDL